MTDFLEKELKKLNVDHYEIYTQERKLFQTESREAKVFSLDEAFERGTALRLFQQGRVGFAHGNEGSEVGQKRLVELAVQNLAAVDEEPFVDLPCQALGSWEAPFDAKLSGYSHEEKFQRAQTMERVARETDARVVRVRGARYEEETKKISLKNSWGFAGEYRTTVCELSLMVVAEAGGKQESGWESDFSPFFHELKAEQVGRNGAERALSLLGAKPVSTQSVPALLDPVVGASLLGVLASSFLGDQVRKGRSSLQGKLGSVIYSPEVSLVDDSSYPKGFVKCPFDGEGTRTRPSEVVKRGRLQQFLYDIPTAGLEGTKTTGNAIRLNYKEPPKVGVSNFLLVPGNKSLAELLGCLQKGFWISDLIGVHTADPVTGDFSLGASGYWVEGGKKSHPVRGVAVSGNLHELFNRVQAVGSEIRFYNNYGCPPLLISSIDVGGA